MHKYLFIFVVVFISFLSAADSTLYKTILNAALQENKSYELLQNICDQAGGRLAGSAQNEKAMRLFRTDMKSLGFDVEYETFEMPGWNRGNDVVKTILPYERTLRVAALGFVDKKDLFEAPLVFLGNGFESDFKTNDPQGKIVLVTSEKPKQGKQLLRSEIIRLAEKYQAEAVLFINTKPGGLLLTGTSSFSGQPATVPAFSITLEEGKWLQRLAESGEKVELSIETNSFCQNIESSNLKLLLPGKVKDKIVIGAHFDSWDLGQGAIDNGIGSAILVDVAQLIRKYFPENYYSIELVWFNAEELGLFGSKAFVEKHKDESIVAMINLDMTGNPTGFNVMGFEKMIPLFEGLLPDLKMFELTKGIVNQLWTGSDHLPFVLQGIPSLTFTAHLDKEQVHYYHDFADTFDKVNKEYLSRAAALTAIVASRLANDTSIKEYKLSELETIEMLRAFKIDERLKRQGEWPFD